MARKIRVLFAIDEMSAGGSQRQIVGALQRLDRTRFEPQLYVVAAGGELLGEVPADVPVQSFAKSHPRRRWWYPGQFFRARASDLARVLADQKIDLIYDRTYHTTLMSAQATRQRPTPRLSVIVTDPQRDFENNLEWFRWRKRQMLRNAYQTASCVAAVSEGVRKSAVAYYGVTPDKTLTLHNSFDIDRIDRLMAEPLPPQQARSGDDRFEIVAAGRLHPQKGFQYLLEAVHDLVHKRGRWQVRLRILGTGAQLQALEKYADEHALKASVVFAGYQQNPYPYFRQADLFCLSSLYEGMPNALAEAMLCRVPVLSTDCPSGPAELLYGGRLGRLVPPADSKRLADAIEDAMINPDRWKSRVPSARAHIERSFSPEAGIERLQNVLASLVASSSPT